MSKLTQDMEYVKTYLDDLLILSNNNFKDQLLKLEMVLARPSIAGMRVNASNSKFFVYLGYCLTSQGIQPERNKVEAILNIKVPTPKNKKELRQFIGIVNYYCNMWFCRSELLAPLTSLTSSQVKFEWLSSHQQAFDKIKKAGLLKLRYFYLTQISVNLSTFTLIHVIISWVQLLCRIKSL
jgi:hypothetical protein